MIKAPKNKKGEKTWKPSPKSLRQNNIILKKTTIKNWTVLS